MPKILLIDDDPIFSDELQSRLQKMGHCVHWLDCAEEGLDYLAKNAVEVVLLDNKMLRMSGLEFLAARSERGLRVPVILMTSAHTDSIAIDAIAFGAIKYVIKPDDYDDIPRIFGPLITQAKEVYDEIKVLPPLTEEENADDDSLIIGRSVCMLAVLHSIGQLALLDDSVLILGETGTGKEAIARKLHQHSKRRRPAPYVAINCPALTEQLLESELFGHEKGAFTGADRRHIGKFEHCNGGTLFLDEIGYMPPNTQVKILRVLQDQSFMRLGGNETIRTNVRIVAATSVDLKAAAATGQFRPDLYYRLNTFTIAMPPLRERGVDLPLLVQHFVRRFSRKLGRDVRSVSPVALETLCRYSWPGNIRELQSVLKQALLRATGPVLVPTHLPPLDVDTNSDATDLDRFIAWVWNHNEKELWPIVEAFARKALFRYAQTQPDESQVNRADRFGIAKNTYLEWLKQYKRDEAAEGKS